MENAPSSHNASLLRESVDNVTNALTHVIAPMERAVIKGNVLWPFPQSFAVIDHLVLSVNDVRGQGARPALVGAKPLVTVGEERPA